MAECCNVTTKQKKKKKKRHFSSHIPDLQTCSCRRGSTIGVCSTVSGQAVSKRLDVCLHNLMQSQRWRGKGLLMFPGLFIQPSVWLRTNSHPHHPSPPPTHPPSLPLFRPSYKGSHLKWHCKACDMIGEEHNVVCVRGLRGAGGSHCNFNPHFFWGKLSTHSSI